MSVCNVLIEENRILILSDTCQYNGREVTGYGVPKVSISANGNFAVSVRGGLLIGEFIKDLIMHASSMSTAMDVLEYGTHEIPEGFLGPHRIFQIIIAGIANDGSLGAYQHVRNVDDPPPEGPMWSQLDGATICPGVGPLPRTPNERQFLRLAGLQYDLQTSFSIPLCVGGVMHLTEITSQGASQRIVGLYPDYHAGAAKFGDPNAEAVSAYLSMQETCNAA